MCVVHLLVNLLYLCSWCLLIVKGSSVIFKVYRLLLIRPSVVKGIFLSSSLVVTCGLPCVAEIHVLFDQSSVFCSLALVFQLNVALIHLHWYFLELPLDKSNQTAAKCQFKTWNQLQTCYLFHLSWSNERTNHSRPGNCLSINSSNTFWGTPYKMTVIPREEMPYWNL